ncbi:hypothetical protein [Rhizobium leguminosarum]|jgi:uncharacterized protein YwgA|uniref:hypothetical protein n=1 Tax=Rhizobium leguminosarum TaxID=384 RepID=UPI0010327223|nr:hypothetical protein [Rhizobium leguminosarum]TAX34356.1 hypothetical protein ELI06_08505 [Rhizobium leguminosarum]
MSLIDSKKVAGIIADAGGRVVGRTRLQKVAYLLTVTGMESGFSFGYKHYGPYSEDLASATRLGDLMGDLHEAEHTTTWGGSYSIFTAEPVNDAPGDINRRTFAAVAAEADAVELELAATAVFLSKEGYTDPWQETARRKPEKVENGRLERAKELLVKLSGIPAPDSLPNIV